MSVETLNTGATTEETVKAPEGHDEAMLAKFEGTQVEQPEAEAPAKLAGKFETAEDLERAYKELEAKLGGKDKAPDEDKADDTVEDLTEDQLNERLTKGNVDVESIANHYETTGELADEHYESLEKAGIPRAYVDQYLAGVEAQAIQARDEIMSEIGGQEAFSEMVSWASSTWTPAQLSAYNKAVESGDMDVVRSAVMSLAYKYQATNGRDPKLVRGAAGGAGDGFGSVAQLTEAMKDPRYTSDPAYRKEVEAKLARSNIM